MIFPEDFNNIQFNPGELYSADRKLIGKVELNEHSGAVAPKELYLSEKDFEDLWVMWYSDDKTEGIFIPLEVLNSHGINPIDDKYNIRNPHEYLDQLQPNEYIRNVFEV